MTDNTPLVDGNGQPLRTPTIVELFDFENALADTRGHREARIRKTFGVSPARYFQLLYQAIDHPGAIAIDPVLVNRLKRLRESRRAARTSPTFRPPTGEHHG